MQNISEVPEAWLNAEYDDETGVEVERVGNRYEITGYIRYDHMGRCSEHCDCHEATHSLPACGICDARCDGSKAIGIITICDECEALS